MKGSGYRREKRGHMRGWAKDRVSPKCVMDSEIWDAVPNSPLWSMLGKCTTAELHPHHFIF